MLDHCFHIAQYYSLKARKAKGELRWNAFYEYEGMCMIYYLRTITDPVFPYHIGMGSQENCNRLQVGRG